jgi:hypothetical protein
VSLWLFLPLEKERERKTKLPTTLTRLLVITTQKNNFKKLVKRIKIGFDIVV